MADINVTISPANISATLSSTAAINATLSNTPAINATLNSTAAINATLSNTPAITVTLSGTGPAGPSASYVLTLPAGENIAARDLVYRAADGKVYRADAGNEAKEATGYVLNAIAQDATGLVYFGAGVIGGFSGLTPNVRAFLSTSPGAISTTVGAGDIVQQVGRTLSATQLYFEPQSPIGQN